MGVRRAIVAESVGAGARVSARARHAATLVVLAAVPVRAALALCTDLSPDEAYYLCAARRPELFPPMADHPPLLPWLLRISDGWPVSVELRVRIWPLLLSTLLGLACVELARRRGGGEAGRVAAAWLGSWSLLPMAGGFVATPDGPALLACAALLWWSTPEPAERAANRMDGAAAIAALVGAISKVVVAPVAAVLALASRRPLAVRAGIVVAPCLALPWLWPSLRFQWQHALGASPGAWNALDALGAAGTAVIAQLALWSPWVVAVGVASCWRALAIDGVRREQPVDGVRREQPVDGVRREQPVDGRRALATEASTPRGTPRGQAMVVGLFTLLMLASALARAVPPEPNWWAPAALVVVVSAALHAGQLAPTRRKAMLAMAVLPTWLAATHVARPWLPLSIAVDPTARLHGWSVDQPPLEAPGIGAYGPAAARCIYQQDCTSITNYFDDVKRKW